MKNKKASMPGWVYVVGIIIGLFVLMLIIWVSVKSKGHTEGLLSAFKGLL